MMIEMVTVMVMMVMLGMALSHGAGSGHMGKVVATCGW